METINNTQLKQKIIEDSQNFPEIRLKSDQIEIFDTFQDSHNQQILISITNINPIINLTFHQQNKDPQNIQITQIDLIGAIKTIQCQKIESKQYFGLEIHQLQKQNPKKQRKQIFHTIYHESEKKIEIWKNIILFYTRNSNFITENLQYLQKQQLPIFNQKLLIFVNPAAGAGKSPNFWKDHQKLLDIAGFQYKQIDTEKLNHANEIILKMSSEELLSYQGIVTFSGDGLPHEIINAIQQREDKEQALQIGISALPGGSGNALATSICKKANEQLGMISSIYALIKGKKQNMDLIELQIDDQQKKIYSFVSINYAYIADCDINSEKLRCLGGARFDVYGFYRCLIQKKYPTKIYIKKQIQIDQQQNQQQNEEQQMKKEDWDLVQGNLKYLVISNTPYIGETINSAPLAQIDNGFCDIQILNNTSYISLYKFALTFQNGTHFDIQKKIPKNKDMYYTNAKEFIIETDQKDSLFSIDGEKFTAQNLKGKVIPQALSVFTF
ncbi:ATP-NAD kinase-like domain [Pseudocohnilembus persalinus]|uniref:ATP-NAD kinase-like domain n=1 Tax=Pseudocohnilembus persalinus TaxID=266149 RepID=A0A0V0QV49_PSEPJ|nr:ATP-NAD kinase-like domain [Pseudocohnilembus persalinus]|eukprot:KRX06162.1 ATP-NAD kinase-like domain [Pseudocohnilembus persalinus]